MFRRKNVIDNLPDVKRTKEKEINYVFFGMDGDDMTSNGASSDSTRYIVQVVSYSIWRVVTCGFKCDNGGANGIAELVHIGLFGSDAGATDSDYFGACTQDSTAGKQWINTDHMQRKMMPGIIADPDPANGGGNHIWTPGNPDGLGVWQNKQASITITKKTVGSSTATVGGWVLIEIGDPNDPELVK